jgi:hypothetical protein
MPVPPEKRLRFFVYVIESPSPVDLYHRRSEGEIIRQAASLNQIPCMVKTSINSEAFEAALKIGLKEAMDVYPDLIPILHISAHGYKEGIQLSSGEILNWFALEKIFRPINQALNNSLLLCLSCCEGYSGVRMAMTTDNKDHPFYAIVSNAEKPLWSDTAVAYSTFYHLIAKGYYITEAVAAMQTASGNDRFWIQTAEEAKNGYLEYIENINANEVQQQLEEQTQSEEPEHLAKLVKISEEKP